MSDNAGAEQLGKVVHVEDKRRFVVQRGSKDLAYVEYSLKAGSFDLYHTFTDPEARGKGRACGWMCMDTRIQ